MENKSVKKKRLRGTGGSDRTFYIISGIGLSLFLLAVLYPIVFVVAASFSSGQAVSAGKVFLWPVDFSLEGYKTVFHNKDILIGFKNSIVYQHICRYHTAAEKHGKSKYKHDLIRSRHTVHGKRIS